MVADQTKIYNFEAGLDKHPNGPIFSKQSDLAMCQIWGCFSKGFSRCDFLKSTTVLPHCAETCNLNIHRFKKAHTNEKEQSCLS